MLSKLFIIISINFLFFVLNSCSLNDLMNPSQLGPGEFYAIQFIDDEQHSIILKPKKILSKDKVEVYLDDEGSNISEESINFIIDGFEETYQSMIETFGTHTDVDQNGKIIIIFFDINGGQQRGEYTAGYFYSGDLIRGFGNGAEILYVDNVHVDDDSKKDVLGTVVHEFQHLIDFYMNNVRLGRPSDLWLNEARSEASDMIYVQEGKMGKGRLGIYNGSYGVYHSKTISDGNYFYRWDNITDTATAALFMYWLHVQGSYLDNGIEKGIISDIAHSSKSYGYEAIVGSVNKNISEKSDANWSDILIAWLTSNHITGLPNLTSYDELKLTSKMFSGDMANLYPGDAIISTTKPTLTIANSNVIPIEVSSGTSKFYVTLNKSTDMSSGSVRVNVAQSVNSRSLGAYNNRNSAPPAKTGASRIKHISQGDIKVKF